MAEKKSTMLLWLAGALVLLLWIFSRRQTATSSSGLATFLAPGVGGPQASAAGNIIAGITGALAGFQNGATAPAASNVGNTVGNTYAGINYGAPGSQSYGVAQALATEQAGGDTPLFPALGGSSPIAAPSAPAPVAPSLSFLGANNGPTFPGVTASNDLLSAPAVTAGGGTGGGIVNALTPSDNIFGDTPFAGA